MTKREFLDTVFALAPNEANAIMDAFDEYVESNVVPTGRSGKERRMTKYIIEIPDDVQYVLFNGQTDNKCYTAVRPVAELEVLNSDYINEHYGQMQDEAYQRGYEDGKKSVEDEGLRNNINLIVTQCGYSLDEINDMIQKMRSERT